ncbi:menaquinone-dependent protoporphyrinogen IX dehydrogenase [Gammaproteobacteria bacterium]|nr:menaquinone-dependent protoporphyrinogen IX dehydrogenase [Gammaproteobacteria bacterium]MDC3368355.1 menaquinone-dependent protoporphyrinogen IX dehydrogenase [Gammaproteobacteria bacterium]|tara:strand:+ start:1616 stop:2137 length:522 start_codon:yes stop_codon:yes gene_type:complete
MKSTLIIFSSTDGHTLKICERIMGFEKNKDDSQIASISEAEHINISEFKRIIIGASIRYGKHKPDLYEFIESNLDEISSKENAFFSVNVVARKPEKNTPETNPYVKKFLLKTSWKPRSLEVFAGKIDYPKYNFVDKHMIRFIMWMTKGPTNTNNTYEFTDWDMIDSFAKKVIT